MFFWFYIVNSSCFIFFAKVLPLLLFITKHSMNIYQKISVNVIPFPIFQTPQIRTCGQYSWLPCKTVECSTELICTVQCTALSAHSHLQPSPLTTISKSHENRIVTTTNCYKRTIARQGTELRNSSTSNKCRYEFHIFYFEHNEKIKQLTATLCHIDWLVDYEKPVSVEWLLKRERYSSLISTFWC